MPSVTGVMLGVAEVQLPVRRLPQDKQVEIANLSHQAVLNPEPPEEEHSEKLDKQQKSIGVVDGFYAMDEVLIELEGEQCVIKKGQDSVLSHSARDVIVITVIEGCQQRVVYISRSVSFGRAAVVLQMKTADDVEVLMSFFPHAIAKTQDSSLQSEVQPPLQKDPKSSLSRAMGKKFTSMLASFTTSTATKKSPLKSGDKTPAILEGTESPMLEKKEINPASDSDSEDDLEFNSDDTDSQSEGKYYEDLGLDAEAQERLYSDTLDTASRTSSSSLTSTASVIEAELNFFVESDREFVKSLQSLEEDRQHLAGNDTPQFIREKLALLFMQVKSLIQLHTELHSEFEKSGTNIYLISEAIIRHQIDYESYVYFMENIPTVDSIIQNHSDYFKAHMPYLPEKLRKPRMRLHYYVLTLETVHKKCTSSNEKKILSQAMEILKIPLKRADSKLFLGAVTGSPFDLSDFGNLIRHSDLQLRRGGDLPSRKYHVVLLRTLILLTVSRGRDYQYIRSFRMDQVGLGKQERGVMFNLNVRNGPRGSSVLYIFKAKNINVQQLWINDIKEILSKKSQTPTPRNSFIESDHHELRFSGRRNKVRRGQSMEKNSKQLMSMNSDSEDVDGHNTHLANSANNGAVFNRRTAIKKNSSSLSGRSRPVVRQHSGNANIENRNSGHWRNTDLLPHLSVGSLFPQLDIIFNRGHGTSDIIGNYNSQIVTLIDHEDKYVAGINEQLGSFLDVEFSKPPMCIVNHLREIYAFHNDTFSPLLKKACGEQNLEEIAKCFINYADEFMEIYSNFFADRVRFDGQMQDMNLRNPYVYPILHFELYIKSLFKLQRHTSDKGNTFFEEAISVLRQCVTDVDAILLAESIYGAPFNLNDCGPILHQGTIKVRVPGMMMKQELYMVLLNTMILLLEPRIPNYNYVDAIRMDIVGMGPSPDPYTFQLEVRTEAMRTVTYSFRASDKKIKNQWEQEIVKLLNKQIEMLRDKLQKRLGNEKANVKSIENKNTNIHCVSPRQKPLETSL